MMPRPLLWLSNAAGIGLTYMTLLAIWNSQWRDAVALGVVLVLWGMVVNNLEDIS